MEHRLERVDGVDDLDDAAQDSEGRDDEDLAARETGIVSEKRREAATRREELTFQQSRVQKAAG